MRLSLILFCLLGTQLCFAARWQGVQPSAEVVDTGTPPTAQPPLSADPAKDIEPPAPPQDTDSTASQDILSSLTPEEEPIDTGSYLEDGLSTTERRKKEQVASWMRQAEVASKTKDVKTAEALYLQILSYQITDAQRRHALLDMAKLFDETGDSAKEIAILEKFVDTFPADPGLPQVFIKLGLVYRDMGLYKQALNKFYNVLNYSLKIDSDKLESYRALSVRAQLEIAETHFVMGDYEEAAKFYARLRRLSLSPSDRARAIFQTGYSYYLLKKLPEAISSLETFIGEYPQNPRVAEATFFLSDAYSNMGRYAEASRSVLELLKKQSQLSESDIKQWVYWQKKAGSKLASDFFNQSDYSSALALYQAMLELELDTDWQWRNLYQIGVCFEKLAMPSKAAEVYKRILDTPVAQRSIAIEDGNMRSLFEMAQWRLDHLQWGSSTNQELQKLLDK